LLKLKSFGQALARLLAARREGDAAVVRKVRNAVMLVIRTPDGEIWWVDVSAYLKRESTGGKTVRQIVFEGERFDAVSVQNWRKTVLVRA
jgi:hypothetical protein